MKNLNLIKELQVRETVRDVVFLHNELFFAAAQKKNTLLQFLMSFPFGICTQIWSAPLSGCHHRWEMVGNYRSGLGRSDVMHW
nr:probable U3 small nucleolar RNA-associated protein 7 [Ipomoea batatas]